MGYKHPSKI
jgi:ATP-dependent RNA helicase DDX47/RRP3